MEKREVVEKVRLRLLKGRTWRYLRYIHFRDVIKRIGGEINTVCVCGAGHGYAELAVAAEFPNIKFILTDIVNKKLGYPNYHHTMDMSWKWGIDNLEFSVWNVLEKTDRRFDMIASTEMLEHIEQADLAARNMLSAASKFVYCLVPFADRATNANPQKRAQAWERHEHYVYGYDRDDLAALFPKVEFVAGTYWASSGQKLRISLNEMSDAEIEQNRAGLERQAEADIVDVVPSNLTEALGIKILSRA